MVRAAAHSWAHRGPPATTTIARARWQPYHAPVQPSISSTTRSPSNSYLITPASSVSSVSPSSISTLCEVERTRNSTQYLPRECQLRDAQKSKYAAGLVDQAVKSLCEIWHPQDIPVVFMTSSRPTLPSNPTSPIDSTFPPVPVPVHAFHSRNIQLPSPVSPTTQPSPIPSPLSMQSSRSTDQQCHSSAQLSQNSLVPMKGFVHEVLRRSRTSGSVLQTALCYLEAIRAKVPELVSKEKLGTSVHREPELADRITLGEVDADPTEFTSSTDSGSLGDLLDTVRIDPVTLEAESFSQSLQDTDGVLSHGPRPSSIALPPLPPLPSPLLCPRRTFLASLILASKFMQDRTYSNRAWAKLSGLPPREIGRCERALGDALEWRLWVGKPAVPATSGRSLTKCRSEGDITFGSKPRAQVSPELAFAGSFAGHTASPPAIRNSSGLRRHATLPAGAFYQPDGSSSSLPMLSAGAPWMPHSVSSFAPLSAIDELSPTGTLSTSPSTPGLSYSPTLTESSCGDRTVQMSTFMDVSTPPPGQFATFGGAPNDKVLPAHGPFVYLTPQDVYHPHSGAQIFGSLGHQDVHFDGTSAVTATGTFYRDWPSEFVA
ncbi:hypothetical protein BV22DRAFT_1109651 [Leucogyrophana mollusca]|uniref:Uncharacterized protein n=1 Tax=Leucogyrophana mollusca TaxID=85980 RepID=A0ACB8BXM3_9AGAM|nr:hypothetical protein BV22DRAFT_1109651 [Leucogyrophana mollusca]